MRFSLFWMQKTLRLGDRRGSGREIPRAGNPRPSCLQRFCKRNRGAGLYARVRGGWTLLICPNYNGSGGGRQVAECVFPEKRISPAGGCRGRLLLRERGAGSGSHGREIPHAPQTRSPRLPKHRGRAADRRSSGPNGRQGRRLRSSGCGRPDAHAHAGHASRTLFANATAAIFLRSLSNAAIFLRRICLRRIYLLQILRRP